MTDTPKELLCPPGLKFMPFQEEGVERARNTRRVLLADEQGLGKTVQCIGVLNAHPKYKRVLILCPASLCGNWKAELEKWMTIPRTIGIPQGQDWGDEDIIILPYTSTWRDRYEWEIRGAPWDLVVMDECHRLKNHKSKQGRAVFGSAKVPGIYGRQMILVTGTPIVSRPIDIWPLLCCLWPDMFGDWYSFVKRYCGATKLCGHWDTKGASNTEELNGLLQKMGMIRRLKKDVLKDLPAKTRQMIILSPTEEVKRIRDRETAQFKLHQETIESLEARRAGAEVMDDENAFRDAGMRLRACLNDAFAEMAKVRKEMGLAKVAWIVEEARNRIEEAADPNYKLVIFAWHQEVIDSIAEGLAKHKITSVKYTGQTPINKRQAIVQSFQETNNVQVFIGNISAAGVGITLTAAQTMIFAEVDWVPGNMAQAEDRCLVKDSVVFCPRSAKMGRMSLVNIQDIQVGDTVLTHLGNHKLVTGRKKRNHRGLITTVDYVGWHEPLQCTHDHKVFVHRDGQNQWLPAHQLLPTDSMAFPKNKSWKRLERVVIKPEWRVYSSVEKPTYCIHPGCDGKIEARSLCRIHYRQQIEGPDRPKAPPQINGRHVRLPESIKITDEWLYLFGWYAAEGFSSIKDGKGKFCSFSGHRKETPVIEKIQTLLRSLGITCSIYAKEKSNGIEMRAFSTELAKWFRDWFGSKSNNLSLPDEILNLPPDQASVFLRGYTDGDGYQRKNQVEWVSASQTLCYQICLIAIRSGFIPTFRKVIHPYSKTTHWIGGFSKFGSGKPRLQHQDGDYIYRPIRSVSTRRDKVEVWDISVEDDHSFVCGFSSVHNCHRIGQKGNVLIIYMVFEASIDSYMVQTFIQKQDVIDSILDPEQAAPAEDIPDAIPKATYEKKAATIWNFVGQAMTIYQRQAALDGLRHMAKLDKDGATARNGVGYSKIHTEIAGRLHGDLLRFGKLSFAQTALAASILKRYSKQLPDTINSELAKVEIS